MVRQRRERQGLERKLRHWNWFGWLFLLLVTVVVVLPSIFFVRVAPIHPEMWSEQMDKQVVVPVSEYRVFDRAYNRSLEKGFCLFGDIDEDRVRIREVDLVEDPGSQSAGRVSFTCYDEIGSRWKQLLLSSEYNFLGTAHTHPDYARLSRVDTRNLGAGWWWTSIRGIFSGNELSFYAFGNPVEELEKRFVSESLGYRA